MKVSHLTLIMTFCIWVIVRCLPLILFAGLYGFDAWYHLGIILGILEINRIPSVNPYNYPYYHHAGLHIFTILVNQLTGLPIITCLQFMTVIIAILTFLAFYSFFRTLFRIEWLSLLALLFLALVPDFLVQTNTPIPEAFALIFMPLAFLLILKLIRGSPKILSFSLYLSLLVIFLHFSHHWTNLLFVIGCFAMFIGVLLIRPQNLKTGILATTFPAILGLILLLLDPFTAYLFQIYSPITLLLGGFLLFSIIVVGFKGQAILNQISLVSGKIHIKFYLITGIAVTATILLLIIGFYPIPRPLLWQIIRFAPLAIFAGLILVSLFFTLQKPIKISFTFLICWLILLSLMFISGYLVTLSDPSSWHALTTIASITHRLFIYIAIAAVPLATVGMMLIIALSKQKSKSSVNNWRKSLGITFIVLISCSLFLGIWNTYLPAGGWHQTSYTQTEIQAASWLSEFRNQCSITYLDSRLRWLFQGLSPILPSNHSYAILNPNSEVTLINSSQEVYEYFFVSTLLEKQFMIDFSTPPIQIHFRPFFDINPRFTRLYSITAVSIYFLSET